MGAAALRALGKAKGALHDVKAVRRVGMKMPF